MYAEKGRNFNLKILRASLFHINFSENNEKGFLRKAEKEKKRMLKVYLTLERIS